MLFLLVFNFFCIKCNCIPFWFQWNNYDLYNSDFKVIHNADKIRLFCDQPNQNKFLVKTILEDTKIFLFLTFMIILKSMSNEICTKNISCSITRVNAKSFQSKLRHPHTIRKNAFWFRCGYSNNSPVCVQKKLKEKFLFLNILLRLIFVKTKFLGYF